MLLTLWFNAGEVLQLRSHIYRCLIQLSHIASIKIPKISNHMRYDEKWELIYYKEPKYLNGTTKHVSDK